MIASIVGNYLKDSGWLTEEQLYDLLAEHRKVRAKLGIIAVAEGLMTQEEAERVNRLQAIMDMRFGDIAIEEGYLTEGQVETLLKKQGNEYLAFAQALENQQLMLIEQLEQLAIDFQYDNNFTSSDMEKLKSGDIDQILHLFLPLEGQKYEKIASVAVRTIMRLIDVDVCVGRGYLARRREIQNGAIQQVTGNPGYTTGFVARGSAMCSMASVYGQETFNVVDEDALDAIAEVVNCINGLCATSMEHMDSTLDLCPPFYAMDVEAVEAEEMLILPLRILGKKVDYIIALGKEIVMK
ncbi:MAG: hypothetical protein IKW30_12185 [Lachnospiraceae bacterium]|nr:hypothetical protein [Lachnospiraceae bacterium]